MNDLSHTLLRANILGLNNSVLGVVEYKKDSIKPINFYVVSEYDEMEDTINYNFDYFKNLKEKKFKSEDTFDQFLEIEEWMETLNYGKNESTKIEFCGYEMSNYLNKKNRTNIDSVDIENENMIEFIKDNFHKRYKEEYILKSNLKKNPFAEILLEDLKKEIKLELEKETKRPLKLKKKF